MKRRTLLLTAVAVLMLVPVLGALALSAAPYRENPQDQRFYFPVKKLEPLDVPYEDVWLTAKDGSRLHGVLLQPAGTAKATLLCLHGAGGNAGRYVKLARPLVAAGYRVLILDWRGYGRSEGKPGHVQVLEDSQVALEHVLGREDVKGAPVVLWGLSLGGQVALELARRNEGRVDALVLEGAATGFADLAADHSPQPMRTLLRLVVKGPYDAKEAIAALERTPKLLIQSRDDRDVPYARGQDLFARAREPKRWWETTGAHLHATLDHPEAYVREVDALLARVRPAR